MQIADFDDSDYIVPASKGIRVFESDLGGVSIEELSGQSPECVHLSVWEARQVAAEMLRICERIEVGRAAYERECQRKTLDQRRHRAKQ
jgi:hypothetical protein